MNRIPIITSFLIISSLHYVHAQELKIALIDMEAVFDGYYKTIEASETIKQQENIYTEYARNMEKERSKLEGEFNQLRDESQNIALSDKVRETKKKEAQTKFMLLQEKQNEMKDYSKSKQVELHKRYLEKRNKLVKEITAVIKVYAEENGYDFVIDSSGQTYNAIPVFIYFKSDFDITEEILVLLNKGHEHVLEAVEQEGGTFPDLLNHDQPEQ